MYEKNGKIRLSALADKLNVSLWAVRKAVNQGRISAEKIGKFYYVDEKKALKEWENNRKKATNHSYKSNNTTKNTKSTGKRNYNKIEKHIGTTNVQESFEYEPELNDMATFKHIAGLDTDEAPPEGSVAYYQAYKLAVDAVRNFLKLLIEAGNVILVSDAVVLFGEILASLATALQAIPDRITGIITGKIKKSVKEWRENTEHLIDNEVRNIIKSEINQVLTAISREQNDMTTERVKNVATKKRGK